MDDKAELRDRFAESAMKAIIGSFGADHSAPLSESVTSIAHWSYEIADAMLARREK